jgi:hypothetical protein
MPRSPQDRELIDFNRILKIHSEIALGLISTQPFYVDTVVDLVPHSSCRSRCGRQTVPTYNAVPKMPGAACN